MYPIKLEPNDFHIDEELLERMIQQEELIRMYKAYQDLCTAVKSIPNGWLAVTDQMQTQIARDFGFGGDQTELAVNTLRRAQYLYPNNPIFKLPVYIRNNKAREGTLRVSDTVPTVDLIDLDHKIVGIGSLLKENSYNIFFLSSVT